MPEAWLRFTEAHIYTGILVAATVEGLGLPIPSEVLYVAAGILVGQGKAALAGVILTGVTGNFLGSLMAYLLAYLGGARLLHRWASVLRIRPAAFQRMEEFFRRYGAATVFLSRFVGFIRAATIYSAGLARMKPWTFAGYLLASLLLWHSAWAWIAVALGGRLPRFGQGTVYAILVLLAAAAGGVLVAWRRRAESE